MPALFAVSEKSEYLRSGGQTMKTFVGRFSDQLMAVFAVALLLAAGLACNLKSDDEWKRELAHKKLSRASTSGSISDKVTFYFCPTGEYAKQSEFSGYSPGGAGTLSMADSDVELGRWEVRSGTLVLRSQTGETSEYSINQGSDGDVIQLNGNGYLVTTHNECQ